MTKDKWEIIHKDETAIKGIGILDTDKWEFAEDGEIHILKDELKFLHGKKVKLSITLSKEDNEE